MRRAHAIQNGGVCEPAIRNKLSRARSQVSDVIDMFNRKLSERDTYIRENLEGMPQIRNWRWPPDFSEPAGPLLPVKRSPHKQPFSDV